MCERRKVLNDEIYELRRLNMVCEWTTLATGVAAAESHGVDYVSRAWALRGAIDEMRDLAVAAGGEGGTGTAGTDESTGAGGTSSTGAKHAYAGAGTDDDDAGGATRALGGGDADVAAEPGRD